MNSPTRLGAGQPLNSPQTPGVVPHRLDPERIARLRDLCAAEAPRAA